VSVELKTSVRVLGADQVDEFRALCVLLGRRPHQLAADLVLEGIRRYRENPETAPHLAVMVEAARSAAARRENEQASNVIPLRRRS
jgi:hypothetical protein